jgi:hypothetical protein
MDDVIFSLGKDRAEIWEAIAAIQIMQATDSKVGVYCTDPTLSYLYHLAGFRLCMTDSIASVAFRLDEAYRSIDGAMSHDVTYQAWLARVSGVKLVKPIAPVKLPRMARVEDQEHIAFCPFALAKLQPIPMNAWKAVLRFLRTFGLPVYLIGDPGQRADGLNFTEGCMMSDALVYEKLRILASAKLVVGMPNAWTWLTASWNRSLAIYYPNDVPSMRWYGFYNSLQHGRIEYVSHQVQIPLLLTGLRQLLADMQNRTKV